MDETTGEVFGMTRKEEIAMIEGVYKETIGLMCKEKDRLRQELKESESYNLRLGWVLGGMLLLLICLVCVIAITLD